MSLLNAIVTWSGGDASTPSRRSPPTSPFDMREAGPVVVGVSGGRTSAVLLDRVIEASGGLPDDVHPVFTDTGEELPETYQFLERLEAHYGIELVRLRRPPGQPAEAYADYAEGMGLALEDLTPLDHLVVDYEVGTRRRGVPFALFGGPARWCTTELKMREAERWAVTAGIQDHVHLLGIRADEPARVRRTDGKREARPVYPAGGEPWLVGDAAVPIGRVAYETVAPLAEAGVTAADVLAFWRRMPFDLEMPSRLGNCGGCPLKNRAGPARLRSGPGGRSSTSDGWPPLCRCSRAHRGRPTMAAGGTSAASASPTDNLCRSPSASGAAWGRTRSMRWRRRRTMRRLCR